MSNSWVEEIFKFIYWLLKATVMVLLYLSSAVLLTKYTGALRWVAGVVLCGVGLGLYIGNVLLTRSFLINRTLAPTRNELETGTGHIPKWVSLMGLLGISALAAAEIWFIVYFFA